MPNAYVLIMIIFISNPSGSTSIAMHDFDSKDACEAVQHEVYDRRTADQWPAAQVEVICVPKGSARK